MDNEAGHENGHHTYKPSIRGVSGSVGHIGTGWFLSILIWT